MLHHHNRVGAIRYGRAGHNFHGLPPLDSPFEPRARANFADDFKFARSFGGADCKSIAHGARRGRRIAVGRDVFRQHASGGSEKVRGFDAREPARRANALDHYFAGFSKG